MNLGLRRKYVLLAGASKGTGRAVAEGFATIDGAATVAV